MVGTTLIDTFLDYCIKTEDNSKSEFRIRPQPVPANQSRSLDRRRKQITANLPRMTLVDDRDQLLMYQFEGSTELHISWTAIQILLSGPMSQYKDQRGLAKAWQECLVVMQNGQTSSQNSWLKSYESIFAIWHAGIARLPTFGWSFQPFG